MVLTVVGVGVISGKRGLNNVIGYIYNWMLPWINLSLKYREHTINNKEVNKRMKAMGYTNAKGLLNYYWQTLFQLIDKDRPGTKKIVWQEVLDMKVNVTNAIAHVWKGNTLEAIMNEMATVTAAGHHAILSSCWYLDLIKYGADWGYIDENPIDGIKSRGKYYECDPTDFKGTAEQKVGTCDIIDKAMARYQKLSFPLYDASKYSDAPATLTSLSISVAKGCTTAYPQLEMDESYNLVVDRSKGIATLTANEVWGALRGLETFSQLVYQPKKNQDLMAQNKMNVLHWHLVDSESFPYTSVKFPNMSTLGAYTPAHVYSVADMKKVMDYARLRGIRVVPEFDTPGHAGAWGKSFTHLLPTCYNSQGFISELSNIMDPTLESTFTFLSSFFAEALALFKDNYMHFGGDEVSYDMQQCWANNPEVTKRMKQLGYSSTSQLLNYYWNRLFSIIDKARAGTKKVVWQEVLDMNVPANTSIAHVWKGGNIDDIMNEMAKVTANGHRAILSSCWYLNYIKYGADWGYIDNSNMRLRGLYYECDPTNFQGTAAQKVRSL
ncbi:glycosyl hydrolase family 20, catalytic domain protein [Ancylostoma ceylanicum]|uniref:beta-N-acetylhexosaminidase n=1 Tax=Ancylostoma ceylanicum TaxID=53326 RepID=A0A0D6L7L6_9BILA|nr:glycosyl hydrolase family 20, catalytic domain protein [Ancylostoma ceylanicum]